MLMFLLNEMINYRMELNVLKVDFKIFGLDIVILKMMNVGMV